MSKASAALCVILIAAIGCKNSPTEPKLQSSTMTFGGYHFLFEFAEGEGTKTEGSRNSDGKGNETEDFTVICGKQLLRIINGKLTLNDADRGTVKQGDTIKLTSGGELWVNQQPRGNE